MTVPAQDVRSFELSKLRRALKTACRWDCLFYKRAPELVLMALVVSLEKRRKKEILKNLCIYEDQLFQLILPRKWFITSCQVSVLNEEGAVHIHSVEMFGPFPEEICFSTVTEKKKKRRKSVTFFFVELLCTGYWLETDQQKIGWVSEPKTRVKRVGVRLGWVRKPGAEARW